MQTEHEDEREHRKESFDDPAERQHSEIQNGHSCEKNNAEKEHPPETSEDGWNLKEEVGVPKEEEEEAWEEKSSDQELKIQIHVSLLFRWSNSL